MTLVCVCGRHSPGLCLAVCAQARQHPKGHNSPELLRGQSAPQPQVSVPTTAKVQSPACSRRAQGCRAGAPTPGHAAHSSGLKPGFLGRKPIPCLQLPGDAAPLRTKLPPDALLQLFKLKRATRAVEGRAALKPHGRRSLVSRSMGSQNWTRLSDQALHAAANYFFPF